MPGRPEADGSPRYWAWLYSPPPLRAVLESLFALETEIGATLNPNLDHEVAHVRLEWWRQECARYAEGAPVHPLMRTLLDACGSAPYASQTVSAEDARGPAARPDPGGLVDTATWDLAAATFATRAELEGYCDRWASAVTEVAARSALAPDPDASNTDDARERAARFGRSMGGPIRQIELLVTLDADARRGRLRLPLDELERAGVDPSALRTPPWPGALCRLLRDRHRAARAALERSAAELPPRRQPALRGLIVWAAVAHRRSVWADRALPRPPRMRVASRLTEVGLGWRAARRADRQAFHL
jgi:15-cis-phytoene synthase